MPNASGDIVKADKERPTDKRGQIGAAKLFDLPRKGSWPVSKYHPHCREEWTCGHGLVVLRNAA